MAGGLCRADGRLLRAVSARVNEGSLRPVVAEMIAIASNWLPSGNAVITGR